MTIISTYSLSVLLLFFFFFSSRRRHTRLKGDCTFFFSSRRRHTRLQGDWSSDVCSSDLAGLLASHGSSTMWCGADPRTIRDWVRDSRMMLDSVVAIDGRGAHELRGPILSGEIGRASCRERV